MGTVFLCEHKLMRRRVAVKVLPTAKWGRTPGKKLVGLRVLDVEAQQPPGFGPSLRRWCL